MQKMSQLLLTSFTSVYLVYCFSLVLSLSFLRLSLMRIEFAIMFYNFKVSHAHVVYLYKKKIVMITYFSFSFYFIYFFNFTLHFT